MLLWNPVPVPVFDPSTGEKAGGALAYFYVGGTTTPLAVFGAGDGAAPLPWPVVADANGVFPPIFIPYGPFGYRVTDTDGTIISPNVATVQNPAPPTSGGGGGIVVTQDQILNTGDTMWTLRGGSRSGWVPMNGGTVGNAGSGAGLRANADAQALFTFLYNNVSDAIATVSGGRTTASADFSANKTIIVPTMQGLLAGGLDDMGANAANRIQIATTITTTNASTSATVASAANLVLGMYVNSTNVPANTLVTAISGTSITLSNAASASAVGTAARFSMFTDAQLIGSIGGVAQKVIPLNEIPPITPSGTVTGSVSTTDPGTTNATGSTAGPQTTGNWQGTGSSGKPISATFAGNSFGGGLPSSIVQPTRLGTWFMKL